MGNIRHARPKVAVLIPAAGSGERMGGAKKQYRLLGGKPLVVQTCLVFEEHPSVDQIIVAASEGDIPFLEGEVRLHGFQKVGILAGGSTRQQSVGAALDGVSNDADFVLVHDAVRPFVSAELIDAVIDGAREFGAAAAAIPVSDTLRKVDGYTFAETVPREGLMRMQTPQGFSVDLFRRAHRHAVLEKLEGTDDVALVQVLGTNKVCFVAGDESNFKITVASDWERAECAWRQRTKSRHS